MTLSSCYALLAALAVLPLVVLCQYDVETTCPERLVREFLDQLVVFDGVCLRFERTPRYPDDAEKVCKRDGGMRVMPKTEEMDQFIRDYMQEIGLDEAWMGLTSKGPRNIYKWDDGTYLGDDDYHNDILREKLKSFTKRVCGVIIRSGNMRWLDEYCDFSVKSSNLICQY